MLDLVRKLFYSLVVLGSTVCNTPMLKQAEPAPKTIEVVQQKAQQEVQQETSIPKPIPYTLQAKKNNPVDKYAIVVVGSAFKYYEGYSDPIDKNTFWLNGTYVFDSLRELDFKTCIFYADHKPDFSEKVNQKTIRYLKKQNFKGRNERHVASIKNLDKLVNKLAKKVDDNDVFVLSISTHGNPSSLCMLDCREDLRPNKLTKMLEKIKPGFGLLYVDACTSGEYIKKLNLDDYVIISATDDLFAWGDRGYSSSRYFFRNLSNTESDTNVDGKVTIGEAFEKTKEESVAHMKRIEDYLLNDYLWGMSLANPEDPLQGMSVVPVMKVGKNVSDGFYLFDSWYFKKD